MMKYGDILASMPSNVFMDESAGMPGSVGYKEIWRCPDGRRWRLDYADKNYINGWRIRALADRKEEPGR